MNFGVFCNFLANLAENRHFPENHQNSNFLKNRSRSQKMIPGTILEILSSGFPKELDLMLQKPFLMPFCDQNCMVQY